MEYTIKGREGVENFVRKYFYSPDQLEQRNIHIDQMVKKLFHGEFIIKDGVPALQDADTISVELQDEGYWTMEKIAIVKTFVVTAHDSFLLKLVKQ